MGHLLELDEVTTTLSELTGPSPWGSCPTRARGARPQRTIPAVATELHMGERGLLRSKTFIRWYYAISCCSPRCVVAFPCALRGSVAHGRDISHITDTSFPHDSAVSPLHDLTRVCNTLDSASGSPGDLRSSHARQLFSRIANPHEGIRGCRKDRRSSKALKSRTREPHTASKSAATARRSVLPGPRRGRSGTTRTRLGAWAPSR